MNATKQDSDQRALSVLVSRSALSNSVGGRLEKYLVFLNAMQSWKRVTVEATPHDSSDSVFYAPFPHDSPATTPSSAATRRPIPTQFLTVDPYSCRVPDLVSDDDDFELSFVGMNVTPQDLLPSNPNELLLYSVRSHIFPDAEEEEEDQDQDPGAAVEDKPSATTAMSALSVTDSNGIDLLPCDVPFIHYDPVVDGHDDGSLPNTFLPVPASKSVIRQHRGGTTATFVPVRFTVMEIDKVTSAQARACAKIDSVNVLARRAGVAVPFSDIISSAVAVANTIGKRALRKYTRPDHLIAKDMEFRLVSKAQATASAEGSTSTDELPSKKYAGTYLRYGYYFFLRDKVDAKLYAQTDASSQNVPLLMRRQGYDERMAAAGEKEFFPLSGVSYVVMKVSAGCTPHPRERMRALAMENRVRLEHVLHMSDALEKLAGMI